MTILVFLLGMAFTGCANSPRCANPEGSKVILYNNQSCSVRIRQVVIGSELKISESLKAQSFNGYKLDWVEGKREGNKIELGHFVLVPKTFEGARK